MHASKTICEYFVANTKCVVVVLCYFQVWVWLAVAAGGLGINSCILKCASDSTTILSTTMTPNTI